MTETFTHWCDGPPEGTHSHGGYGAAVTYAYGKADGSFWVGNDEYVTRVRFCPFCGEAASTQTPDDESAD